MTYLIVSKAVKPNEFGRPDAQRLVYRVVLDDETVVSLPEVARKLGVPYPSLAARVHRELTTIGTHEDAFFKIISEVKKRARTGKGSKSEPCAHCNGTGRQARAADLVP